GARPKAYLHAALHAQELPGIVVLEHLVARLAEADAAGKITGEIIVVPFANPIGLSQQIMMEAQGRYDLDTNRNYNRGFPDLIDEVIAAVDGNLTDDGEANIALIRRAIGAALTTRHDAREADVLKLELLKLSHDADLVLDLHSAWEALLHLFVTDLNWPDASDLARQINAEVVLIDRGNRMMTFKSAHALLWKELAARFTDHPVPPGCLTAVVELRGQRDVDDHLTKPDADNLFHWLQRRGVIAGTAGPLPEAVCEPRSIAGLHRLFAEEGGIVVYHSELGDHLREGQTFAHILEPQSGQRTAVVSPVEGLLYARRSHRFARKGQYFCAIAGDAPIEG
ncbi:MAG: succinylglutamate desuccinylase/aspartoacylase family protein, partial [Rhodospirillaceae bacterium]|nr:succinylglutamate desuccinylase/aspartoacylase family protein [Rhodospirillaceae bacterium]